MIKYNKLVAFKDFIDLCFCGQFLEIIIESNIILWEILQR